MNLLKLLKHNHVKHGLIMTAVILICLILMEITGQNQSFDQKSPIVAFSMFIAPAIIWYFGIKAKKKAQKNILTFKEGVKEGFKISLVYALTSPFVFAAYYLLINPAILDYVRTSYGMSSATDTTIILTDMLVQFLSAVIFGTIYAAIISFFLKSKK